MGDRITDWMLETMPGLVSFIGGMGEWECFFFALVLLGLAYLIYAAAYNLWLTLLDAWYGAIIDNPSAPTGQLPLHRGAMSGGAFEDADWEEYDSSWMDEEKWYGR